MDLVPSLMTTHTVPNPEYDPVEAERIRVEKEKEDLERAAVESEARERRQEEEDQQVASSSKEEEAFGGGGLGLVGKLERRRSSIEEADLAFGQEEDDLDSAAAPPPKFSQRNPPPEDDDGGDIGGFDDDPFADFDARKTPTATPSIPSLVLSPPIDHSSTSKHDLPPSPPSPLPPSSPNGLTSPSRNFTDDLEPPTTPKGTGPIVGTTTQLDEPLEDVTPVLPGVSTSLSAADENITLDIRWTILSV